MQLEKKITPTMEVTTLQHKHQLQPIQTGNFKTKNSK
jgi:hypothetical protein